jgi:prefoldin subunit 5
MTKIGSTNHDDNVDEGMQISRNIRAKTATMSGISAELQIQKQQIQNLHEKIDKTTKLIVTLQGQLKTLEEARIRELQFRVGTGPTA